MQYEVTWRVVAAFLRAVVHALVLEAESVLATTTSAATAEALGRAAEYGLEEGLLVSPGGFGLRGCGEGDPREALLSRLWGAPCASLFAALGAARGSRRVPRRVSWGAPLPHLEGAGVLVLCYLHRRAVPLPHPNFPEPPSPLLTLLLKSKVWESPHHPSATLLGELTQCCIPVCSSPGAKGEE